MKLILATNEGLLIKEFLQVELLNLHKRVQQRRLVIWVKEGVEQGVELNQTYSRPKEKEP